MARTRPMERERARKGLGARGSGGKTRKAGAEGRMTKKASHGAGSMPPDSGNTGKPRRARAAQAQRRTRRDNSEAGV